MRSTPEGSLLPARKERVPIADAPRSGRIVATRCHRERSVVGLADRELELAACPRKARARRERRESAPALVLLARAPARCHSGERAPLVDADVELRCLFGATHVFAGRNARTVLQILPEDFARGAGVVVQERARAPLSRLHGLFGDLLRNQGACLQLGAAPSAPHEHSHRGDEHAQSHRPHGRRSQLNHLDEFRTRALPRVHSTHPRGPRRAFGPLKTMRLHAQNHSKR